MAKPTPDKVANQMAYVNQHQFDGCQGNTIISVTRPPIKIKQERKKRERERDREKRGLAQWF